MKLALLQKDPDFHMPPTACARLHVQCRINLASFSGARLEDRVAQREDELGFVTEG